MKRTHLIFGVLLFITFAITGRYMRIDFPDKEAIPQELRILMRSRHIYILFSSLLHLLCGAYFVRAVQTPLRTIQYVGSLFLFVSSLLLVWAFAAETYQFQGFSELSRNGIYFSLAAVVMMVIGSWEIPFPRKPQRGDNH